MTMYLIGLECAEDTDARILEVEHSSLVVKQGEFDDNGTAKCKYFVSEYADPYAVNYIFWGNIEKKKIFEEKKESGKFIFPVQSNCQLCKTAQI